VILHLIPSGILLRIRAALSPIGVVLPRMLEQEIKELKNLVSEG